jgi:hypothetical protein
VSLPTVRRISRFSLFAWPSRGFCMHDFSHYYVRDVGNSRPSLCCLSGDRASNFRSFKLALRRHDHCSIILELNSDTLRPVKRSSLTHHHSREHLAPELRGPLGYGDHYHVTDACCWNSSESTVVSLNVDDFQLFRAGIISAKNSASQW